jgi:hypothetical protein
MTDGHICAKCNETGTTENEYSNCPRGGMHDFRTPEECMVVRVSMLKHYRKYGPKADADFLATLVGPKIARKRGRARKHTRAEIEHMRDLYFRKDENWSIGDIARFFRTSSSLVNKAVDGTLKGKDDPE